MILLELFWGFLRVGCFSFGGGYAAVALIREVVLSYGWLSEDMLSTVIAVSESTPGPIMVNLATYVGSTQAGIPGALVATFAVVLPAFCILLAIMAVLKRFMENTWVRALMLGLKAGVTGVILATGLEMLGSSCYKAGTVDWTAVLLVLALGAFWFGLPLLFKRKRKLSPILLIVVSAVLGAVFYG